MMTTTVQRPAGPTPREQQSPARAGVPGVVPGPPKPRRRWGVFAAMAALVCVGAVGNVWLHQATTNAQQVVAARSLIERGTVIGRDQLMTVQVGTDPALRSVPVGQLDSLVGRRAAVDVAAGSLLTGESVTDSNIPGQGFSLVGVGVSPEMMPGTRLVSGDRVRIVGTGGAQGQVSAAAPPVAVAAVVVGTEAGTDTTGLGPQMIITVQVPSDDAARLAAMAASGTVALVLDSRDR